MTSQGAPCSRRNIARPWGFSLLLAVCFSLPLRAQPDQREQALKTTVEKTVRAIASGDSAVLASIVDPQGISVGADNLRHSASSFRYDLTNHTGLYCELFQKGCKTQHNPQYTLGYVLSTGPADYPLGADVEFKIDKDKGTFDYIEPVGGDLIVTFSYRFVGGKWYLYGIHYV